MEKPFKTNRLLFIIFAVASILHFSNVFAKPKIGDLICSGKIVQVSSGDRLQILCNGEIRKISIAEIDAPEIASANKKCEAQPFGDEAKNFLKQFEGKYAEAFYFANSSDNQLIARVYARPQFHLKLKSISLAMVYNGFAHANSGIVKDKKLLHAQRFAKERGVDVWSLPDQCNVPPLAMAEDE